MKKKQAKQNKKLTEAQEPEEEEKKVVITPVPESFANDDLEEIKTQHLIDHEEVMAQKSLKATQTGQEFKFFCKPCRAGFYF